MCSDWPLSSDLLLLEHVALTEHVFRHLLRRRLYGSAARLHRALQILLWDPPCTEHVPVTNTVTLQSEYFLLENFSCVTGEVFVQCLHNSVSAQHSTFSMSGKNKNQNSCSTYTVVSMTAVTHLHCRRQTRVGTRTWIRNPMATLYYAEHVHIAQTQTWIPTPYYCVG